jgi:hypothetical protein
LKKIGIFWVVFILLAVNSFAQNAFDYLKDSLVNVLTAATAARMPDFEYKEGGALWGVYLEPGSSCSLSLQYEGGVPYLMLASAHHADRDIDLRVFQGQGNGGTVVVKDTNSDAAPVVRFIPSSSGWYTFELTNSSPGSAFVSLVVLKNRKNANFSFTTLVEALDNTLICAQSLADILPPDAKLPPSQWVLFGGNVRQGNSTGYYNTKLAGGAYFLVGAGEKSVRNCDVEVLEQYAVDNQDGRMISRNTSSEYPFDYAIFAPNTSKNHNLQVYNRSSQKTSSFMFGFLIQAIE